MDDRLINPCADLPPHAAFAPPAWEVFVLVRKDLAIAPRAADSLCLYSWLTEKEAENALSEMCPETQRLAEVKRAILTLA